jgi:hypothetical protein
MRGNLVTHRLVADVQSVHKMQQCLRVLNEREWCPTSSPDSLRRLLVFWAYSLQLQHDSLKKALCRNALFIKTSLLDGPDLQNHNIARPLLTALKWQLMSSFVFLLLLKLKFLCHSAALLPLQFAIVRQIGFTNFLRSKHFFSQRIART